jgi:homocysteine S-methyltransferase
MQIFWLVKLSLAFRKQRFLQTFYFIIDKPAWITFSCKDERHLNDGTTIEKGLSLITNHQNVFAIGVNCTAPKYISGIIRRMKAISGDKKIVVYPNSGEAYNAESKTWEGLAEPKLFVEMAKEWTSLGADVIGGCCRIGPEHIRRMNKFLINS